jgi:hypothetical protein
MADEERIRKPRIDCPVCGRNVVARKDGSVTHHYPSAESALPTGFRIWCEGGYR